MNQTQLYDYELMKKSLIPALALLLTAPLVVFGQTVNPDSVPEIHITRDAKANVSGIRVVQISGTTFYGVSTWGKVSLRWTIKTTDTTGFYRRLGESTSRGEIKVDDYLTVTGDLESGDDILAIQAKTIKDLSNQKEKSELKGTIRKLGSDGSSFILTTENDKDEINLLFSTTSYIVKGSRIVDVSEIKPGDRVMNVSGTLDHLGKTFAVQTAQIYVDLSQFTSRNFQGTLKSIESTALPTKVVVTVLGKEYTVELGTDTPVLNKTRAKASLARFIIGDTIRFYGAIQEGSPTLIKAEIIRNIDL